MKLNVNDEDNTNQSNSWSNAREGETPCKNDDIKTSDIDGVGETADAVPVGSTSGSTFRPATSPGVGDKVSRYDTQIK